jgi:hypothetical protein
MIRENADDCLQEETLARIRLRELPILQNSKTVASLGVTEHWDNDLSRQYSRNKRPEERQGNRTDLSGREIEEKFNPGACKMTRSALLFASCIMACSVLAQTPNNSPPGVPVPPEAVVAWNVSTVRFPHPRLPASAQRPWPLALRA